MGRIKSIPEVVNTEPTRKALTREGRENQMIALTMDRVEERIRNGTASAAEYVHFLKLSSTKEKLEKEKLELEKELLQAKTENLKSQRATEELYRNAIRAMHVYSGNVDEEEYDEYEEDV